jgi:tRNA threonylcarbamoyladenosine biosynthesis protein TsaE
VAKEVFLSHSAAETFAWGKAFAAKLQAGTVLALMGDMGAGKTVLAQGLASGLGIDDAVTSPTFVIVNEYTGGRLPFFHFDIYRVEDTAQMDGLGFEEYLERGGVVVIEWAERISELLAEAGKEQNPLSDTGQEVIGYWRIDIGKDLDKGEDYRHIRWEKINENHCD